MKRLAQVYFRSPDGHRIGLKEVLVAENAAERARGLLGREPLRQGQGMYIAPCRSVHSFGMRYALDLVYIDGRQRVCKVVHGLRKWRISGSLRAHGTLELMAGEAKRLGLSCGQEVEWNAD